MEMTKKKYYEAPSMEVVELKLQGSLLAGSEVTDNDGIPNGNAYGGGYYE